MQRSREFASTLIPCEGAGGALLVAWASAVSSWSPVNFGGPLLIFAEVKCDKGLSAIVGAGAGRGEAPRSLLVLGRSNRRRGPPE